MKGSLNGMKKWKRVTWLFLCCLFYGCTLAKVDVAVLSERTTLENQVLGTYNSLDDEMLLAASVRAVDSAGRIMNPPGSSGEHKDVMAALQLLSFHEDDLFSFKKLGWVGENNQGLLTRFEMKKTDPPESLEDFAARYSKEEFDTVIGQINAARETVMKRVIYMNEDMTQEQMPEIRAIFGKLNAESALAGEKIQNPDGEWIVKK